MPTYTTNYNLAKPLVNSAVDQDLWGGYLNSDMDIIDSTMKTNADNIAAAQASIAGLVALPIGAGCDYYGTAAPTGFLFAFGQAISRTTYASLFALIGTTYGAGDGATTFNLPDKRGRVSAGKDNMGGVSANRLTGLSGGVDGDVLGASGGLETHTLTIAEMPSHNHPGAGGQGYNGAAFDGLFSSRGSGFAAANTTVSSQGGDGAHNNVQPTFICNYIIRVL